MVNSDSAHASIVASHFAWQLAGARQRWGLTRRESDVLGHLAWGEANKTIALGLDCAESTVETHVTKLLRKSGADARAVLVAKFWTSG